MQKTPPDQVERVARLYRHNAEAAAALGITARSFRTRMPEVGGRDSLRPGAAKALSSETLTLFDAVGNCIETS
ncbi:MAG: hypothetical protein VCF24_02195 [Candidatus Latescibacterota bacterium]